jgi:cephalosporin hydroxylase
VDTFAALSDSLDRLAELTGEPVEKRLKRPLRELWFERVAIHRSDSYAGVPISKFPEDLRVYEHLIWHSRPSVIIELGAQFGASALWFRDRLRTLAEYGHIENFLVISVDVEADLAREQLQRADPRWTRDITLVSGDVRDPQLPVEVGTLVPQGARCLVVEDSLHTEETTRAALQHFAQFVPPGGFFVVEDGCVDIKAMRPRNQRWVRGVLPAIDTWLATPEGSDFLQRRDLELYGITCHPGGFLQRRLAS